MHAGEHQYSYNDLHRWSTRLFEKLGWMALAYRDDKDYKIYGYLRDLADLIRALEVRVMVTTDPMEKDDLLSMYKNVHTLRCAAEDLFGPVAKPHAGDRA